MRFSIHDSEKPRRVFLDIFPSLSRSNTPSSFRTLGEPFSSIAIFNARLSTCVFSPSHPESCPGSFPIQHSTLLSQDLSSLRVFSFPSTRPRFPHLVVHQFLYIPPLPLLLVLLLSLFNPPPSVAWRILWTLFFIFDRTLLLRISSPEESLLRSYFFLAASRSVEFSLCRSVPSLSMILTLRALFSFVLRSGLFEASLPHGIECRTPTLLDRVSPPPPRDVSAEHTSPEGAPIDLISCP